MAWLAALLGRFGIWILGGAAIILMTFAKDVFDGLLFIVDFVLGMIPAGFLTSMPTFDSIDPQVSCFLGALGVYPALGVVASAILLRIPMSFIFRG